MAADLSSGPGGAALDTSRAALIRWNSRARSLEELELELARMWAVEPQNQDGEQETHV